MKDHVKNRAGYVDEWSKKRDQKHPMSEINVDIHRCFDKDSPPPYRVSQLGYNLRYAVTEMKSKRQNVEPFDHFHFCQPHSYTLILRQTPKKSSGGAYSVVHSFY